MKKYLSILVLLFVIINKTDGQSLKKGSSTIPIVNDEKIVFQKVEVEAEFPGGFPEWIKYLEKNLNGNIPSQNNAPKGKYVVILRFLVSKDGSVSEILTEVDPGYGTANEAKRIIAKSPKWKPGKQNGFEVNSLKRQTITFIVQ